MTAWKDPIVEEVRNAGEKLAREAGNNLHAYLEKLRAREREHPEKIVDLKKLKKKKASPT